MPQGTQRRSAAASSRPDAPPRRVADLYSLFLDKFDALEARDVLGRFRRVRRRIPDVSELSKASVVPSTSSRDAEIVSAAESGARATDELEEST